MLSDESLTLDLVVGSKKSNFKQISSSRQSKSRRRQKKMLRSIEKSKFLFSLHDRIIDLSITRIVTLDELSDGRLTNVQQQLTSGNEANDGNRRNSIFSQQFETLRASGNKKRCRSRSSISVVTASGKRNASRNRFSEKLPLRLQIPARSQ